MNIEEFFHQSAGKWFSHRTGHNLESKQSEHGKSEIVFEILPTDHLEAIAVCQECKVDRPLAACSAKITWNGTMDADEKKQTGSTVVVSVPDPENRSSGKLLQKMAVPQKTAVVGHYSIGSDDVVTLTVKRENFTSIERLWFASPNLRMRVSVNQQGDEFNLASFTSEIRMGVAPPAKA